MSAPRWTPDVPTEPPTAVRGEDVRRRALPLDAHLCAWIAGLTLAVLICLAFGARLDALATAVTR